MDSGKMFQMGSYAHKYIFYVVENIELSALYMFVCFQSGECYLNSPGDTQNHAKAKKLWHFSA